MTQTTQTKQGNRNKTTYQQQRTKYEANKHIITTMKSILSPKKVFFTRQTSYYIDKEVEILGIALPTDVAGFRLLLC